MRLETLIGDVRYAARGFRRSPGFVATAVLSLALGIGANTAIFTLLNVALFKPLPVRHPQELVQLTLEGGERSKSPSSFGRAMWEHLRDTQDIFAGILAYGSTGSADLSTGGESRPIAVGLVSGGFFSTLGVRPAAGRLLADADDARGCEGVVVITHAFWHNEFGGDPSAVGRPVHINGRPFEVVGVAESRFFGLGFGYYPPVWAPQCAGRLIRQGYGGGGELIARLKPGVTIDEARAQLTAQAAGILEATVPEGASTEDAARHRRMRLGLAPFARGFTFLQDQYGEALGVLMALVGVVLLIACANTANLLLARATSRQREIAVRLALGASRGRVIRQLLTEATLLSLFGAAAGMLLAAWGTRGLLIMFAPRRNQLLAELNPDATILAFTAGIAMITALLFGLAPALRAVRGGRQAMIPGARGVAEGQSRFGVAQGLVAAQLALSLVMVAGAGLLVGSWQRLHSLDPGFRTDGVVLVTVNTRAAQIPSAQLAVTYQRILERLRSVPGVLEASTASRTPMGNTSWEATIEVPGQVESGTDADLNEVSERYFATIGTPLVVGRNFGAADTPSSPRVAIVSHALARRFFGGNAVGQRFALRWGRDQHISYDIIGIVADAKDHALTETNRFAVYLPVGQNPSPGTSITFAARGEQATAALTRAVTGAIMDGQPRLSLTTRTLEEQVGESLRLPRTLGALAGVFGLLALVLAAIGLYGVLSYAVASRRNELGVRIALGAARSRIIRLVLGDVGRMLLIGVGVGIALSLVTLRLLSTFLFGVEAGDLTTLTASSAMLALVAVAAALGPALGASRVNPVVALRPD